jgi:uncharacterized protein YjiK
MVSDAEQTIAISSGLIVWSRVNQNAASGRAKSFSKETIRLRAAKIHADVFIAGRERVVSRSVWNPPSTTLLAISNRPATMAR